jgi:rubrerythrin
VEFVRQRPDTVIRSDRSVIMAHAHHEDRRTFLKGVALASGALLVGRFAAALTLGQTRPAEKEKPEVKSTLENLTTAFNGESNAQQRYLAFAKKAEAEGYVPVASLFRAAARAEQVHAASHAAVIKKMGGTAEAKLETPVVKSTRENLEAAIKGETYELEQMYPGFIAVARKDGNRDAIRTFNYALAAEGDHAKLYTEALKNLDSWKSGEKRTFYVCPVCGHTVTKIDFEKCPTCFTAKDKFESQS